MINPIPCKVIPGIVLSNFRPSMVSLELMSSWRSVVKSCKLTKPSIVSNGIRRKSFSSAPATNANTTIVTK